MKFHFIIIIMVYCITSDATANCVLPVVYVSMIIGNVAYILLVFKPMFDEPR